MGQMHKISKGNTKVKTTGFDGAYETTVTLYNTCVVKFDADTITLNSGGHRTSTTKARMNQTANQFNLGYNVYQKKGKWFVSFGGCELDFQDGMELNRHMAEVE